MSNPRNGFAENQAGPQRRPAHTYTAADVVAAFVIGVVGGMAALFVVSAVPS